jgi:cell wall-associated NlpC family hydrolase
MKYVTRFFSLIFLVECTFVSMAHAERISHHPWFAHNSETEFIATPSAGRLSASTARRLHSGNLAKGDRIVEQANRYRGTRYRFGGDSKYKGFDCSGLVSRVYNDLNIKKLPHNSNGLYKMGHPVHMSELRPGDLVFFKNTYKHGISHVGVYAGNNQFIHARNRHYGVTVTSLADPYYQLHYAGARRLY